MRPIFRFRDARIAGAIVLAAALSACAGAGSATEPDPAPAPEMYAMAAGPVRARPEMPLFVVDGERWTWVLENGSLRLFSPDGRELLPDDIELVEMLTGPTVLEQYGPAARHGVLLIRTRTLQGSAAQ